MASSNSNPWANQESDNPWQLSDPNQQQHPAQNTPVAVPPQQNHWTQQEGHPPQMHQYSAPSGPPPGQTRPQADETARFVPESERGEQREAFENFEMSRSRQVSSDDQNIEKLTQQFPSIDSALIAAIYNDSRDMGASREMLIELSDQMKADGS